MKEHKALSTKELAELIDLSSMAVRTKMIDLVIRGLVVEIKPVPREAIAAVRAEEDFVELLLRELEWPIPMSVQRLADVATPQFCPFLRRKALQGMAGGQNPSR
ncbi:MAG: hypothetical protein GQ575_02910 [Deltaproteobacteria bacterium]|nr:hypothetical protein [Deltaproteobacteria bacterium]